MINPVNTTNNDVLATDKCLITSSQKKKKERKNARFVVIANLNV